MVNSAGSIAVEVVPDATGFVKKLQATLLPAAAKMGDEFGKTLGDTAAKRIKSALDEAIKSGGGSTETEGSKRGESYGGAFARSLKAKLEAALRDLPDIKIDADSSDADRAIAGIREDLQTLHDRRIGIDISEADAKAKLDELQAKLDRIGNESSSVQVKVDTASASARLKEFQVQVDRLALEHPTVQVDADTAGAEAQMGALRASSIGAGGGVSFLTLAIAGIGPALIPVAAVGVGVFAAIATAAIAAGAAVGVLALALGPVIGAITAVVGAHNKSAQAAGASAKSTNQLANAQDGLKSALKGVQTAEADAADARVRSAERIAEAQRNLTEAVRTAGQDQVENARRVADAESNLRDIEQAAADDRVASARQIADAERAVQDAQESAARSIAQADQNVAQAERSLAEAQRGAKQAQDNLNQAREQAVRDAEDLANRLTDGKLNERGAIIAVQRAQIALDQIRARGGTEQDLAFREAQLSYDQSVQSLKEIQQQNSRTADEKAKSDQAGVEGSKVVQSAQQQLAAAQQRQVDAASNLADAQKSADDVRIKSARSVADAQQHLADTIDAAAKQQQDDQKKIAKGQQAVTDAVAASAESQRQDQLKIADAQRSVTDAQRAAAEQARHSADSIAAAQQAVVQAHRAVEDAAKSSGAAGGAAADTVAQKLAALTPAGRAFVTFVTDKLIPAFHGLSQAAQEAFLPGLQRGIETVLPLLGGLKGFVTSIGTTMGKLAEDAGKALTSPVWTDFFKYIGEVAGPTIDVLARSFGNLLTGFAGLLPLFEPVRKILFDGLLSLTQKFADFGKNAKTNPQFQAFLKYVQDNGPLIFRTLGDVAGAIGHIIIALAPFGPKIVEGIDKLAKIIKNMDPAKIRAIALAILAFVGARKALGVAGSAIEGVSKIGSAIGGVGKVAKGAGRLVGIGGGAAEAAGVGGAAAEGGAALGAEGAAAATGGLALGPILAIGAAVVALGALFYNAYQRSKPLQDSLKKAWQTIMEKVKPAVDQLKGAFEKFTKPGGPLDELKQGFNKLSDFVAPILKFIVDTIAPVIGAVLGFVISTIGNLIDLLGGIIDFLTGVFTGNWGQAWKGIKEIFGAVWDEIKGLLSLAWEVIKAVFKVALEAIKLLVTGIFTGIYNTVSEVITAAKNFLAAAWQAIYNTVSEKITAAKNFLAAAWQAIYNTVSDKITSVKNFLAAAWQAIYNAVSDKITSVKNFLATAWQAIYNTVSEKITSVKNFLATAWQAIYNTVSDKITAAKNILTTTLNTMKGTATTVLDAVTGVFTRAWTAITGAFNTGVGAVKTAWGKVQDAAKAPVRFVIDTVINKGIIGAFNTVASWFGAKGVGQVALPQGFAEGGLLRGKGTGTSDSILARVSNGEYIVRAKAVKKLGKRFLDIVNRADKFQLSGDPGTMLVKKKFEGRLPGFASGGAVDPAIMSRVGAVKSWLPRVSRLPYVWGGVGPNGYDCSGIVGEVWARLTGRPSYRRDFITTDIIANPGRYGFVPGTGMYTVGVSSEHTDGNLNGLGFEAPHTGVNVRVGSSAQPTSNFPHQYYLASLGTAGAGSGGGGPVVPPPPSGISLTDPIGSAKKLLLGAAGNLSALGNNAFGSVLKSVPGKVVDVAISKLTNVFKGIGSTIVGGIASLLGLADGGLVSFDQGGWLPQGVTSVINGTGKPEPVLSGAQWDSIKGGGSGGGGSSVTIHGGLTIQMPTTAGTLDMLSHADRMKAARSIHEEITKLGKGYGEARIS